LVGEAGDAFFKIGVILLFDFEEFVFGDFE
jgi:hypothetical protein